MPLKSIDRYRCISCGACEIVCPADCIRLEEGGERKAYPAYPEDCEPCFQCVLACPTDAIEIAVSQMTDIAPRVFSPSSLSVG